MSSCPSGTFDSTRFSSLRPCTFTVASIGPHRSCLEGNLRAYEQTATVRKPPVVRQVAVPIHARKPPSSARQQPQQSRVRAFLTRFGDAAPFGADGIWGASGAGLAPSSAAVFVLLGFGNVLFLVLAGRDASTRWRSRR